MKESGKLYTLVTCPRAHGVGEEELSSFLLVRVTGEGRAPNPVPLGKTYLVERGKCFPSVCAPVWSGNFTDSALFHPWLHKSELAAPSPDSGVSACNGVLCSWMCPWFVLCCFMQVFLSISSSSCMKLKYLDCVSKPSTLLC